MSTSRIVPSPAATGGAGTVFEQQVDAFWLSLLLVGAPAPGTLKGSIVEVAFQTRESGWSTDDFLITVQDTTGERQQLAGQTKTSFTVSTSDEDCKRTILGFWNDYCDSEHFSRSSDRLLLVVSRGTTTLLSYLTGLLDWARTARDADEFERRLTTPGAINKRSLSYCDSIRRIIRDGTGTEPSRQEIWPFLRVLSVLSLDLGGDASQTRTLVRTLLAFTATEADALVSADATWAALIDAAGRGMARAARFRREDLPASVLQCHSPAHAGTRMLGALAKRSEIVLAKIKSTLGSDVHLARQGLVAKTIEQLETAQVVLLSGVAGSGKSCVAKDVVQSLGRDEFVFCFRAEEFAQPALDATLQLAQIGGTPAALSAVLAGQGRKCLLVESLERLLERDTRDAFADLLTLVSRDPTWRLLITCREYSTDLVRDSFLLGTGLSHVVLEVPLLSAEEIDEVAARVPTLAHPLSSAPLRRLLCNPYFLDKATRTSWSGTRPLPSSERELRDIFWRQVIRADGRRGAGMPRRREAAFIEIALRRAHALAPYADVADIDAEAVEELHDDALIALEADSLVRAAPAHDVLEDWAVLRWLDDQFALLRGSYSEFSTAIGNHPAIRRSYRKWLAELAAREASAADTLFQAAVLNAELPSHFRDDTLASLLVSSAGDRLLEGHAPELLRNDKRLLWSVIHLLRVGCVQAPDWLGELGKFGLHSVPRGPAWPWMLRFVAQNVVQLSADEHLRVLGFIEDWARAVSPQSPYPDGSESAAAIGFSLLEGFRGYGQREQRKRCLKVILKIPSADEAAFASLLEWRDDGDPAEQESRDARKALLDGIEAAAACRDAPSLVMDVTRSEVYCDVDEARRELSRWSTDLEPAFGLRSSHRHFPPSAWRDPFFALLRAHPHQGIGFVLEVVDRSTQWYACPPVPHRLERPFEITLSFADGTTQRQWCNGRLWGLYRGITVGPYFVQSALMGLERYLLTMCDQSPSEIGSTLLSILRKSNSAAVSAVVASVATAYPRLCGDALLVLLGCRACIDLDRSRMVADHGGASRLLDSLPGGDPLWRIWAEERKQSDALPHRRRQLEGAALELQASPLRHRVEVVLDSHRRALPSKDVQTEEQKLWRLALQRMDLREYEAVAAKEETDPDSGEPRATIQMAMKPPPPDIQEIIDESAPRTHVTNELLSLQMWGIKVLRHEDAQEYRPAEWRARLESAKGAAVRVEPTGIESFAAGAPAQVAAVCVRDNWNEMSESDRRWCADVLSAEVESGADDWDPTSRIQASAGLSADRAAALVLPQLVARALTSEVRTRAVRALAKALTHPSKEVRLNAAAGVGMYLWSSERDLALRCANALATEAELVMASLVGERRGLLDTAERGDVEHCAAIEARHRLEHAQDIRDDAARRLGAGTWIAKEWNQWILRILAGAPSEPDTVASFETLAAAVPTWWAEKRSPRSSRREENLAAESSLEAMLAAFLVRADEGVAARVVQPIVEATAQHPREVGSFVRQLVTAEDARSQGAPSNFWMLWQLFADALCAAPWLPAIDEEHARGRELMGAVLLTSGWKETARDWKSLAGRDEIHRLVEALPPSAVAFDDYLGYLSRVGSRSLPGAFVTLARLVNRGDAQRILANPNAAFMLEVVLRRYVYGRPASLKRDSQLRDSVLSLLDALVESGSSAAFLMRDDFVTPAPPE